MVDLIFTRSGWRRTGMLGKGQADIDLLLEHPITAETAWVQVKSRAGRAELDDYLSRFQRDGSCDRFFFVCHSPDSELRIHPERNLHVWAGEKLAAQAIEAGLFNWLRDRCQ